MKTIAFEITGSYALLLCNPAATLTGAKKALGAKKEYDPAEEAEKHTYRLPSGQLCLPSTHFLMSTRSAVSGLKIGKFFATKLFKTSLFESDDWCALYHPDTRAPLFDYEIDTRRAVIGTAGVLRSRPKIAEWGCKVCFEVNPEFLTEQNVLEALKRAGEMSGVGDFRPSTGGKFGRFTAVLLG